MNIAPGIPGIDMSYPSTKLRFVVAANDPTKAQNFAAIYETMFGPETNTLPPTLIGGAYP